ncbi:methyltransferase domain-containing protein [Metabacillus litoralis]|uniref:methyltransferase domain-containing protein n=1 Tax=Metabacillus litoralis TaxID=152268 RepID=UPI001CFE3F55|nr:methyltransferase domain-containing protein [Metabacillus litoralis]
MAMFETAKKRAELTNSGVIDARTLENSHKRLREIIKPGTTILDVGCGTGAMTYGIAKVVGTEGMVVGIDNNPVLIDKAREKYKDIPGLSFKEGDVYNLPFSNKFDVVTSARLLQWLAQPKEALINMVRATKVGGKVIVLDYNHEKIKWDPEVPESMKSFYGAFLRWRLESGMDNTIADKLSGMFNEIGLEEVTISSQHEKTNREDKDFQTHMSIWSGVALTRGKQMVDEGFIKEEQRKMAEHDYRAWIEAEAKSQFMYLLAVEGIKI